MPDPDEQKEINDILWRACDTFRGTVDPAEYKNYILAMLFLHTSLMSGRRRLAGTDSPRAAVKGRLRCRASSTT